MSDNYFFELDPTMVAYNDESFALTFSDEDTGDAVDISGWTNMTYKALSTKTTDTIEVAHAAMSRTSSGSGTTDTVVIPISTSDSAITQLKYNHEFSVEIAGQKRTIFRGTIKILDRRAEVP